MPKEIANKTNEETYYKCTHCGYEIYWNTHKKMVMCKCGALGVDGCDKKDRKEIKKEKYENKRFTKVR